MKNKNNYLIFAHYHSKGLVRKDIIKFLIDSKNIFTQIVFISTKINSTERKKIPPGIKVLSRKNVGYDFISYKKGWEYLHKKLKTNYDNKKLFFVNSSILFVKPGRLLSLIKNVKIKKNEFWGISRSLELTDHIGTYFFFFRVMTFKTKFLVMQSQARDLHSLSYQKPALKTCCADASTTP